MKTAEYATLWISEYSERGMKCCHWNMNISDKNGVNEQTTHMYLNIFDPNQVLSALYAYGWELKALQHNNYILFRTFEA